MISLICIIQPDFAQGLHNLLIQSISNDTNLVKAVGFAKFVLNVTNTRFLLLSRRQPSSIKNSTKIQHV